MHLLFEMFHLFHARPNFAIPRRRQFPIVFKELFKPVDRSLTLFQFFELALSEQLNS